MDDNLKRDKRNSAEEIIRLSRTKKEETD